MYLTINFVFATQKFALQPDGLRLKIDLVKFPLIFNNRISYIRDLLSFIRQALKLPLSAAIIAFRGSMSFDTMSPLFLIRSSNDLSRWQTNARAIDAARAAGSVPKSTRMGAEPSKGTRAAGTRR